MENLNFTYLVPPPPKKKTRIQLHFPFKGRIKWPFLLIGQPKIKQCFHQRHVQAHNGVQRFAMVSGLNDMFPENSVQQGLRYFSLVWWVCQKCQSNQQKHVYEPRGINNTACTMGPSEVI